jgi:hypothetical protein
MTMPVFTALVYVPVLPQAAPAATQIVDFPLATANLMAFWMVRNGLAVVPSAELSFPLVATGTQVGQSSSMAPSQSSSTPSQVASPWGLVGGTQALTLPPEAHAATVVLHAPMPQLNEPSPSSTCPSQLSSSPLQASPLGVTSPTQGPHAPCVQMVFPARHAPTPFVAGGAE